MNFRIIYKWPLPILLVCLFIETGCRRKATVSEKPGSAKTPPPATTGIQPPKPQTPPSPGADTTITPAMPPQTAPKVPPPPRLLSNKEAPFSICAVTVERNGDIKVGVVDKATKASALLRIGRSFDGYELVSYDNIRDAALFVHAGEQVLIGLQPSSTPAGNANDAPKNAPPAPAAPIIEMGGPPLDRIDLTDIDQQNMKPTEDEKQRGIDPNDASTWPEGYRGPVIERLMQKQKDAGIEPETSPIPLIPQQ